MKLYITLFFMLYTFPVLQAQEKQYNVLFIAVDDLNDYTGFLGGHPQTKTPNMDKLAGQSLVFTNAHCAASVCNPSRAAIMSGIRPTTSGILGNKDKIRSSALLKDAVMLNQWFQENGYFTLSRGKIYHTPIVEKEAWDLWSPVSGNYGKPKTKEAGKEFSGLPTAEYSGNLNWGGTDVPKAQTPDYLNAEWASKQLEGDFEKPFFMALGIFRPHLSWFVPQEYFDKFPPEKLGLPTIKMDDLEDIEGAKPSKEFKLVNKHHLKKEVLQAYLASVNYADECVGLVLDALAKSRYADNTIVVLWGDHGWHLGEKLRYKKFTFWEEATKSPLIIKVPGVTKPGSRTEKIVSLLDLYPTLTDLCNLPQNKSNEGISLKELIQNNEVAWKHSAITSLHEGSTIRKDNWRYTLYNSGVEELYNHESDVLEHHNLVADPAYKSIKNKLKKELQSAVGKSLE
ncbi:sulfatase [Flexithrix dorotheae]|uniref:sulfatase n=1 Tax=Flexithrix dorotheae TaxID=70993 RepID=UPI0007C4AEF0|nr:sulfatase [Flexithrix dorotheae]